jgi:hypothetical protein
MWLFECFGGTSRGSRISYLISQREIVEVVVRVTEELAESIRDEINQPSCGNIGLQLKLLENNSSVAHPVVDTRGLVVEFDIEQRDT